MFRRKQWGGLRPRTLMEMAVADVSHRITRVTPCGPTWHWASNGCGEFYMAPGWLGGPGAACACGSSMTGQEYQVRAWISDHGGDPDRYDYGDPTPDWELAKQHLGEPRGSGIESMPERIGCGHPPELIDESTQQCQCGARLAKWIAPRDTQMQNFHTCGEVIIVLGTSGARYEVLGR